MKKILTFIIPVRHPENAENWSLLKKNLAETMRSISAQNGDGWQAIIVANKGSDLPVMPPNFSVTFVEFAPNQNHAQGNSDLETFRNAFRIDKGRRVLSALVNLQGNTEYVMIVDDDDFVHRDLTSFASKYLGSNGWIFEKGYVWSVGSKILYKTSDFSMLCGTSHIIRTDLMEIPATFSQATDEYIRTRLGSHIYISQYLEQQGSALDVLPFPGAVYRVGHANAHSRSKGLLRKYLINKDLFRKPITNLRSITNFNWLSQKIKKDYWGDR